MTMTRNAIGNLINRYKAVLQKCNLMNTFGSLAVAAMLVMGGAGVAMADIKLETNVAGDPSTGRLLTTDTYGAVQTNNNNRFLVGYGNEITLNGVADKDYFAYKADGVTLNGVDINYGTLTLNGRKEIGDIYIEDGTLKATGLGNIITTGMITGQSGECTVTAVAATLNAQDDIGGSIVLKTENGGVIEASNIWAFKIDLGDNGKVTATAVRSTSGNIDSGDISGSGSIEAAGLLSLVAAPDLLLKDTTGVKLKGDTVKVPYGFTTAAGTGAITIEGGAGGVSTGAINASASVATADIVVSTAMNNPTSGQADITTGAITGGKNKITITSAHDATVGAFTATSGGGDFTVTAANGAVSLAGIDMSAGNGKATVSAKGKVTTSENIAGGTGGVEIKSTDGDIDAAGRNITGGAGGVTLSATKGAIKTQDITGGSGDVSATGKSVETGAVTLKGGDVILHATGSDATDGVTVGAVTASNGAAGNFSATADNGDVSLAGINMSGGAGSIEIKSTKGNINATGKNITGGTGAVNLTAGGDIGTGNITGGAGGVTLSAANKVTTAAITSKASGDVSATGKSVETGAVTLDGGGVTLHATGGATTDSVTVGAVTATAGAGNFSATADNGAVSLAGINMAAGTGKATVTADGNVTTSADIAGGAGGIEITSTGGDIDAAGKNITAHTGKVTLSATNGEIKARNITTKTLSVNAQTMKVDGELHLTGEGTDSSTINADMDLTNAKANVKDLVVDGNAAMSHMVAGSQFTKLKVTGQTTFDNNSEIAIGDFNPVAAVKIGTTGDSTDKTIVNVQNFTDGTNANTLSRTVTVYEGATLGYGAADMQALKSSLALAAAHGAPMNGGVYAAARTLKLDGGSVNVGNLTNIATLGDANFGEGATLAVDQRALGANPVFTKTVGTATVAFAENSNVVVTNAQAGDLVIADGGFAAGSAIDKVNVHTDTDMLTGSLIAKSNGAVVSVNNRQIVVPITVRSASDLFPGLDKELCALIDGMYADRKYDVDSSAGGVKFLSRATDNRFLGKNKSGAAKTIEGAARMISIAGVPQMAMAASNAATGAIVSRTSIGDLNSSILAINSKGEQVSSAAQKGANAGDELAGLSSGNGYDKSGLAMWIMPLWQSTNNFGMKAGNFDMDMSGNLGGIALGVDYTFEQAIRAGISFNIGGGHAKGSGDFATSENRMNFWGLGAYLSSVFNNLGVTADVNYTSTFNDIRQDLNADLRMGSSLKSEVYASALTAGLRGEYKFRTDVLDIMPYVGVRYMYLHTDEYDVKAGGDKIYKGDAINQHIWTFPVGVQFSKDIALDNGWYVKPSLELNITPAAGDVKSKNDIKFTGVNGSASMETQIMDHFTYGAQAGLEFGNDNLKLGLNYSLQAGAHTTNHGVFGTFRYEF